MPKINKVQALFLVLSLIGFSVFSSFETTKADLGLHYKLVELVDTLKSDLNATNVK